MKKVNILLMNPLKKRKFKNKCTNISLPDTGEYLGVKGLLQRRKHNRLLESDNYMRDVSTLNNDDIGVKIDDE